MTAVQASCTTAVILSEAKDLAYSGSVTQPQLA
jgi:hypothetical protein